MLLRSTSGSAVPAQERTTSEDASHLLRPLLNGNKPGVYLNPIQEEYFVNLFWQSYHTSLYAIIDEAEFKKEYQALYLDVPSGYTRKPSALVDIVVAMCMHHDVGLGQHKTIWDDPPSLAKVAESLEAHTVMIERWVQNLPGALKNSRVNNGRILSTDGSALVIEQYAPLWLQRQRLLLELEYHHMSVNLYRPFISFKRVPAPGSRLETLAVESINHAIELSKITQQALSSTAILDGWHEAFQWQWNSAITLAGFILANPRHSAVVAARSAMGLALSVFGTFGESFELAKNAETVVGMLCTKIDGLISTSSQGHGQKEPAALPTLRIDQEVEVANGFTSKSVYTSTSPELLTQFADFDFTEMAVGVDFWANIDMLGVGDISTFGESFVF
ncbi:Transcription factor [Colletotrichum scovillei]|nr:Transcription factor [Colletotrichum scovillei]KAH8422187.1 Transcription factor [Colletotrichum scovillei]